MNIVTAGAGYIDIDAYGGCIAYAELLNLQGSKAIVTTSVTINESVTSQIRSWGSPMLSNHQPDANDTFTLIDVSDPDFFDPIVDHSRIDEIIDHHPGFESKWKDKIGDKARIEPIGAACTLVYESWLEAGKLQEISQLSARLLVFGILDNTLNFKAKITTDRDRKAYTQLLELADLKTSHAEEYFRECQAAILANPKQAIVNDCKDQIYGFDLPLAFGQMVVWDASEVLEKYRKVIATSLSSLEDDWVMNLIDISHNKSILLSNSPKIMKWLSQILGVKFDKDGLAQADRLWLRKEINQASLSAAAQDSKV